MFTYVEHKDKTVWANYYIRKGFEYERSMFDENGYKGSAPVGSGEFKKWLQKNKDEM